MGLIKIKRDWVESSVEDIEIILLRGADIVVIDCKEL